MARGRKKSQEDTNFDKLAKILFKGTLAQVRKKFRSQIFQEWMKLHPEIVEEALAPPASSTEDVSQIVTSIILEKQVITLKELLLIVKQKSVIKTQKALKPFITKADFPPNYRFTYPKRLVGASILRLEICEIPIKDFLFHLHQAYDTAPSKMGTMIEIPVLAEILNKNTGWEINQIYNQIYQAYLDKKVDLQPGKATNGKALEAEDGSRFFWFQFR